ncbi:MAG: DUF6152 family protein [Pseudomonadota bacterium]
MDQRFLARLFAEGSAHRGCHFANRINFCFAPLSLAHHSRAAFSLDQEVTLNGVVSEVSWTNPHYYLSLLVPGPQGPKIWTLEGHSIPGLVRYGWSKDTVQVGQQVTVVAHPNVAAHTPFGLLDHIILPDGEVFYSFRPRPSQMKTQATAVSPSSDFSGTWRLIRSLRSNLVGGFAAPTHWPLLPHVQAGLADYSMHDDPSLNCEPRGIPRMLHWPYAQRWTWDGDVLIVEREHSTEGRRIPPEFVQTAAANPTGIGQYAIDRDGTLRIRVNGFTQTRWGSTRGVDSGPDKAVIERYRLEDEGMRLSLSYEIFDPDYMSGPYRETVNYAKVFDFDFAEEPGCDVYTARRHLEFEGNEPEPRYEANKRTGTN